MLLPRQGACRTSALLRRRRSSHVRRPRAHLPVSESKLGFAFGAAGRWAHLDGPDGAMDRRVCLPHAATATFEAQSAPAYAVIIAALTEPRLSPHLHQDWAYPAHIRT